MNAFPIQPFEPGSGRRDLVDAGLQLQEQEVAAAGGNRLLAKMIAFVGRCYRAPETGALEPSKMRPVSSPLPIWPRSEAAAPERPRKIRIMRL